MAIACGRYEVRGLGLILWCREIFDQALHEGPDDGRRRRQDGDREFPRDATGAGPDRRQHAAVLRFKGDIDELRVGVEKDHDPESVEVRSSQMPMALISRVEIRWPRKTKESQFKVRRF